MSDKQTGRASTQENQMFTEYHKFRSGLLALSLLAVLYAPCAAAAQPDSNCPEVDAMRDTWQRPAEVMDAMGATVGSAVADIGASQGYFTFHLARRVGLQGKVYATELHEQERHLNFIRACAKQEGLSQIETIIGADDDPHLPKAALDAILLVDTYHAMHQYNAMLKGMYRALKPGGKLIIIDQLPSKPGKERETHSRRHEMPEEWVRKDTARNGFRFVGKHGDILAAESRPRYFLVFEKPRSE
jgi:predicted methyltransferase